MIWPGMSHWTSSPVGWCRQECWCSQLVSSSPLLPVPAVHSSLQHKDMNCYKRTWFTNMIYKAPEHPSRVSEIVPKYRVQVHSTSGRCTAFVSTPQCSEIKGQAHTSAGKQHHDKWHEQPSCAHITFKLFLVLFWASFPPLKTLDMDF